MTDALEKLLTFTDAGAVAGVSHTTIGRWVADHGLPTTPMPGSSRRRIRRGDLLDFLRSLSESSATSES